MSDRIWNSLITIEHREGVGEKREQLMIRISMSFGRKQVFFNTLATQSVITI